VLAVVQFSLVVPDYDAAIAYYVGVLGFDLVEDTPLSDEKRWVVVAPAGGHGASILLAHTTNDTQRASIGNQTGGRVAFFLATNDFAADHARMLATGVAFVEEPRHEAYGMVCVFTDPYGNEWDLVERLVGSPT
jgi:catechol 2,3-dioxygenase-like lactoylglutathione lyase family enzyme